MTSDDECKGPELGPRRSRRAEPSYNMFLESEATVGETNETQARPPGTRRGRADADEIRLLRNLGALFIFFSVPSTLVAFAGIGLGVSPWYCLIIAFSGGPLTIWAFVMAFVAVRSSLPDGPEDPPSSGGP
ncbi:hypothetical protein ACFYXF_25890 [Streptomyces sp. NPDC002680]|uniref:hypothetical protein n=1 Tax=Streptomyces sp. NPDC002680 TaxID=3364659 RepID=UPI0036BB2069